MTVLTIFSASETFQSFRSSGWTHLFILIYLPVEQVDFIARYVVQLLLDLGSLLQEEFLLLPDLSLIVLDHFLLLCVKVPGLLAHFLVGLDAVVIHLVLKQQQKYLALKYLAGVIYASVKF